MNGIKTQTINIFRNGRSQVRIDKEFTNIGVVLNLDYQHGQTAYIAIEIENLDRIFASTHHKCATKVDALLTHHKYGTGP